MNRISEFEKRLSPDLRAIWKDLKDPASIQAYLDRLPYVAEERDRSPLDVMRDRQCHCLDGGIFAALALSRLGHRPLILDLQPEPGTDDDHVLALFRVQGGWGAIAKSNYVNLRYREPIYRNLRELAMTYFEWYTDSNRQKTLRAYTRPLDLSRLDEAEWMWSEAGIRKVSTHLYRLQGVKLITEEHAAALSPADERAYSANTQGTDFDWVFGIRPNP